MDQSASKSLYNYDTEQHDDLVALPNTHDELLPYVPKTNPAYRNLFSLLVHHMGKEPLDAYIETLSAGQATTK